MTRAPGLYPNLTDAEYFGDTAHLSASSAKILLGHRPPSATAALEFGSLCHRVLLEPDRLGEYVALDAAKIGLKADGTPAAVPTMTVAWKRAVAEAESDGKTVVDQADWDKAHRIRDAVMQHPAARAIVDCCTERELSVFGTNTETGAAVRGKFDLLGGGVLADLKTCGDASPDSFARTMHGFGYHISAANYIDLATQFDCGVEVFAFINVERETTLAGCHRVSVIQPTERAIAEGRRLMADACQRWLDNGRVVDLPDYGEGFHTVDLPAWAYRESAIDYETLGETA